MATALTGDPEFRVTTYLVIDFETTTPSGHPAAPIDVAAVQLRAPAGRFVETGRFSALIAPPEHAPLTPFDTTQTGITAKMLAGRPPAGEVLAQLDAQLTDPPYLLVAHNAPTEAKVIHDHREHCPRLAENGFLDTVRLARAVLPDLGSHRLDVLIHHLALPRPIDRHRALPDVEVTVAVLQRLTDLADLDGRWRTLSDLREAFGYSVKTTPQAQPALFTI